MVVVVILLFLSVVGCLMRWVNFRDLASPDKAADLNKIVYVLETIGGGGVAGRTAWAGGVCVAALLAGFRACWGAGFVLWGFFCWFHWRGAEVAYRATAIYFFLLRQNKVDKKKATRMPEALRAPLRYSEKRGLAKLAALRQRQP